MNTTGLTAQYLPTIGIECHVQLNTKTKLFAAVDNDASEADPNTLISHICLGMPGALPVLNKRAIELAAKASFALKTKPQKFSKFDRKHYFYPDLPKGYQISQFSHPIILGGEVDIVVEGQKKKIGITKAHLEEDAGKNTHPAGKNYSLVDLNRAGTPLLEIVSEPDIHSAAEARAYVNELYLLMKYAGVTEGDLYHGNVRFDVNISVSKDPMKLGNRSEIKNLNSFKAVEKAVEFEIKRQIKVLEKGGVLKQETRGWDESKQKTFSQRTKEEAHDYRYFPDPDIPPLNLSDEFIEKAKAEMPPLPDDVRSELSKIGIRADRIDMLLGYPDFISGIRNVYAHSGSEVAIFTSNLLVNVWLAQDDIAKRDFTLTTEQLIGIYDLVRANEISSSNAKALFLGMRAGDDAKEYAENHGLLQSSDMTAIEGIVDRVISENEDAANDVRAGEMKAVGFLVGQVMKASKGQANPGLAQKLIKEKLKG